MALWVTGMQATPISHVSTTIVERVKLNDFGEANREIELFVNGESVINVSGIIIRDSSAGRIRGIQVQSFFGGKSPMKLKDRGMS